MALFWAKPWTPDRCLTSIFQIIATFSIETAKDGESSTVCLSGSSFTPLMCYGFFLISLAVASKLFFPTDHFERAEDQLTSRFLHFKIRLDLTIGLKCLQRKKKKKKVGKNGK